MFSFSLSAYAVWGTHSTLTEAPCDNAYRNATTFQHPYRQSMLPVGKSTRNRTEVYSFGDCYVTTTLYSHIEGFKDNPQPLG